MMRFLILSIFLLFSSVFYVHIQVDKTYFIINTNTIFLIALEFDTISKNCIQLPKSG